MADGAAVAESGQCGRVGTTRRKELFVVPTSVHQQHYHTHDLFSGLVAVIRDVAFTTITGDSHSRHGVNTDCAD